MAPVPAQLALRSRRDMRIAMVCPYALDKFGGVQHQALQLTEWLRDAGHDVTVVAPGESGPDGAVLLGGTVALPANGSRVPVALRPSAGRVAIQAVQPFDVVHVHEPFMPVVSLSVVFGDTPPVVGTFHADPPSWARVAYRGAQPLLRRIARRLDAVTAVSRVASSAIEGFCEPALVPNGLDVSAYTATVDRHPRRVVFLGRDEPRKGLDVLLSAWVAVHDSHPDAELIVMGCSRSEKSAGVTYLGRVSEEVKRETLASSAVYVAPNLSGESFGIVLAEAMAAGCAVVASTLDAFTAVAEDAALYVAPGDVPELTRVLDRLLADSAAVADLARKGLQRVQAFDRQAVTASYVEQYRRAINSVGD